MAVSEDAVKLKEQGNKAFKEHDWPSAIALYTQAIDLYDQEASFYTNRAQVSDSRFRELQRARIGIASYLLPFLYLFY